MPEFISILIVEIHLKCLSLTDLSLGHFSTATVVPLEFINSVNLQSTFDSRRCAIYRDGSIPHDFCTAFLPSVNPRS